MKIGEASRLTGASQKAIRLYEQKGLLPPVQRQGAYRSYSEQDVRLIGWIRQAQMLGFRLSELDALRSEIGNPSWTRIRTMLEAKRARITTEIERLRGVECQLAKLADELQACDGEGATMAACE